LAVDDVEERDEEAFESGRASDGPQDFDRGTEGLSGFDSFYQRDPVMGQSGKTGSQQRPQSATKSKLSKASRKPVKNSQAGRAAPPQANLLLANPEELNDDELEEALFQAVVRNQKFGGQPPPRKKQSGRASARSQTSKASRASSKRAYQP